jgi:hypothetical protein
VRRATGLHSGKAFDFLDPTRFVKNLTCMFSWLYQAVSRHCLSAVLERERELDYYRSLYYSGYWGMMTNHYTPWKINIDPENHQFLVETDLPTNL